jgi:ABC-type phosphate/phosphonate transport system substrate-binding protein
MPKTQLSLSYYPWITQSISGDVLRQAIDKFRGLLETALRQDMGNSVELTLQPVMEVPDQLKDIKQKPKGSVVAKIGLLNPVGYALAHADTPNVKAVAVIRRKIPGVQDKAGPTYKAQLYVRAGSPIKTAKDMRGHSMGFGSPQSTSNFLVPAMMLWKQGVHPLNGFSRVEFTGGHDKSAIAVYQSKVEIGAGHDGVIINLADRPGFSDAKDVLKNIDWSEDIPSDPVAVHAPEQAVRNQIAKALIRVANPKDGDKSEGNKAVNAFWGTTEGFEKIAAEAYKGLLRTMSPLGLRPDDILRK